LLTDPYDEWLMSHIKTNTSKTFVDIARGDLESGFAEAR